MNKTHQTLGLFLLIGFSGAVSANGDKFGELDLEKRNKALIVQGNNEKTFTPGLSNEADKKKREESFSAQGCQEELFNGDCFSEEFDRCNRSESLLAQGCNPPAPKEKLCSKEKKQIFLNRQKELYCNLGTKWILEHGGSKTKYEHYSNVVGVLTIHTLDEEQAERVKKDEYRFVPMPLGASVLINVNTFEFEAPKWTIETK